LVSGSTLVIRNRQRSPLRGRGANACGDAALRGPTAGPSLISIRQPARRHKSRRGLELPERFGFQPGNPGDFGVVRRQLVVVNRMVNAQF